MIFDHLVKHNGKFYPAGTDVPVGAESGKQTDGATDRKPEYKKSDISRMNVADLKKLAADLGIENAEESTGEVLKEAIIAKLAL